MAERIAQARFVHPDGKTGIVQPVGTPLQAGNVYYSRHFHEGHLNCLDCTAPVKLRNAEPSTGGSSGAGVGPFFAPTRPHDEGCDLRSTSAPSTKRGPIDTSKGYLLSLIMAEFSELYNQKSGAYEVSPHGRLRLSEEDLRDRQRFPVRKVDDVVEFLKNADQNRIWDTKVLFQNNTRMWEKFFIWSKTPERLATLLTELEKRKAGTEPPFCAIEIITTGYHNPFPRKKDPTNPKERARVPRAPVDPIAIGSLDQRGKPEFVSIDVYLDDPDHMHTRHALNSPGHYLVMGEVRHGYTTEYKDRTLHRFSIKVDHPMQVTPVNIANIAADLKHAATTPRPSASYPTPAP